MKAAIGHWELSSLPCRGLLCSEHASPRSSPEEAAGMESKGQGRAEQSSSVQFSSVQFSPQRCRAAYRSRLFPGTSSSTAKVGLAPGQFRSDTEAREGEKAMHDPADATLAPPSYTLSASDRGVGTGDAGHGHSSTGGVPVHSHSLHARKTVRLESTSHPSIPPPFLCLL